MKYDFTSIMDRHGKDSIAVDGPVEGLKEGFDVIPMRVADMNFPACPTIIEAMAERGVATNVHYKPLPLLTAYKDMGFSIDDYPHALAQFENEVTLPLHTLLSDDDVEYVLQVFSESYERVEEEFDRAEAQERP